MLAYPPVDCHLGNQSARWAGLISQLTVWGLGFQAAKLPVGLLGLRHLTVTHRLSVSELDGSRPSPIPTADTDTGAQAAQDYSSTLLGDLGTDVGASVAQHPYIGELTAHGLGTSYTPISAVEHLLEYAAVHSGMSWFGGIIGCTLLARICLLPVVLSAMRTNRTLMNLRPEAEIHNERIKLFRDAGASNKYLPSSLSLHPTDSSICCDAICSWDTQETLRTCKNPNNR